MSTPTATLGELCTFRHGGTPSKSNPEYWGGEIPWVSPKDMKTTLLVGSEDSITKKGVEGSATSVVPPGSILTVVRSGILAHTVPFAVAGRPLTFNQDIKAIQVADTRVRSEYVYWFLRSREHEILSRGVKKGATVHSLQSGFLEQLAIPLLPDTQQNRIVDLLSRAENIVRMRREAEQRAKEIIPALFLDMFGDPATNPKGWQLMSLGDVFAQKPNYGTMIPARAELMPWLCLRVANIQGGRLTLADRKYVSLPADAVERHEVRSGDILMARAIGSVDHLGKCVVAQVEVGKWAFDSHLMRIRLRADRADPVWLQALLSSEGGRRLFLEKTRRTAVQFNINTKEMATIRVPVPPVDRQRAFATWVTLSGGLDSQQRSASVAAEGAFQSLLAGAFGEAG